MLNGLRVASSARAIPLEISTRIKLSELLVKPKQHGVLIEFDEKRIDAHTKIGNAAAHGDVFQYAKEDVEKLIREAEDTVARYLGRQRNSRTHVAEKSQAAT